MHAFETDASLMWACSHRPMCPIALKECVSLCLCVDVFAGPAGVSQTGAMWLHVQTHKERQKTDTDFCVCLFVLAAHIIVAAIYFYASYVIYIILWVFFLIKNGLILL